MTKTPLNSYEQVSYDLNLFRERRIAERRKQSRNTPERRRGKKETDDGKPQTDHFPEGMH